MEHILSLSGLKHGLLNVHFTASPKSGTRHPRFISQPRHYTTILIHDADVRRSSCPIYHALLDEGGFIRQRFHPSSYESYGFLPEFYLVTDSGGDLQTIGYA